LLSPTAYNNKQPPTLYNFLSLRSANLYTIGHHSSTARHEAPKYFEEGNWVQVSGGDANADVCADYATIFNKLPDFGWGKAHTTGARGAIRCCSKIGNVDSDDILISIGHDHSKIKRVVVHSSDSFTAGITATLTNGIALGSFAARNDADNTQTLTVSDESQSEQESTHLYEQSLATPSVVNSGCGLGNSKHVAAAPWSTDPVIVESTFSERAVRSKTRSKGGILLLR